jgi:hypothetical protein
MHRTSEASRGAAFRLRRWEYKQVERNAKPRRQRGFLGKWLPKITLVTTQSRLTGQIVRFAI